MTNDYLCIAEKKIVINITIWTVEFLQNVEALVQLSENIHY